MYELVLVLCANLLFCQGGSGQPYPVEHQLVFMKLLNSGMESSRIIMEKVFGLHSVRCLFTKCYLYML